MVIELLMKCTTGVVIVVSDEMNWHSRAPHYRQPVPSLRHRSCWLMEEIDEVIEQHAGRASGGGGDEGEVSGEQRCRGQDLCPKAKETRGSHAEVGV